MKHQKCNSVPSVIWQNAAIEINQKEQNIISENKIATDETIAVQVKLYSLEHKQDNSQTQIMSSLQEDVIGLAITKTLIFSVPIKWKKSFVVGWNICLHCGFSKYFALSITVDIHGRNDHRLMDVDPKESSLDGHAKIMKRIAGDCSHLALSFDYWTRGVIQVANNSLDDAMGLSGQNQRPMKQDWIKTIGLITTMNETTVFQTIELSFMFWTEMYQIQSMHFLHFATFILAMTNTLVSSIIPVCLPQPACRKRAIYCRQPSALVQIVNSVFFFWTWFWSSLSRKIRSNGQTNFRMREVPTDNNM